MPRSAQTARMRRFFSILDASGRIALTGDDARHVTKVLRKWTGDRLDVVLPGGEPASCRIVSVEEGSVIVDVEKDAGGYFEPSKAYTLVQGIPKGQKMDYVIEKCTELGFTRFLPALTERCIVRGASPGKLARWRKLACEAAKQSGRTKVPEVGEIAELEVLIEQASGRGALVLMFWEGEMKASLSDVEDKIRDAEEICLVVGPEGGFSSIEVDIARLNGVITISLGPRIMRTETAPVVAGAAVMYIAGELRAGAV